MSRGLGIIEERMLEETIIAVSTPLGYGGIGVVRLSGGQSLSIAKKIFRPKNRGSILPRKPVLGHLYNFEKKEIFEEAYLTFFPEPQTYTRENVVEISCHGSPVILEELVRLGIKAGARHAAAGEFTLRAYLHGRLDILQAEAINDIIQALSLEQAKISFHQLKGGLSKRMTILRNQIIHCLSQIEAGIEFPDEGLRLSSKKIARTMTNIMQALEKLIQSYDLGKTLREGISLAIIGRANVGKSTLFNALLESERAIVTPHPGTTRDYLREKMRIKNAVFTLVDTAGVAYAVHPAEKEGIKRSKRMASESDGILLLLDASCKETEQDLKLLKKFFAKKPLVLFNKIDLPRKMDIEKMTRLSKGFPHLEISALNGFNLESLKDKIHEMFVPRKKKDEEVILHLRQKLLLEDILASLHDGLKLLHSGYPEEVYVEEIRKAIPVIGKLTGDIQVDAVIDDIFSRFCVGK